MLPASCLAFPLLPLHSSPQTLFPVFLLEPGSAPQLLGAARSLPSPGQLPGGLLQPLVAQSLAVLSRSYSSLPFDVLHSSAWDHWWGRALASNHSLPAKLCCCSLAQSLGFPGGKSLGVVLRGGTKHGVVSAGSCLHATGTRASVARHPATDNWARNRKSVTQKNHRPVQPNPATGKCLNMSICYPGIYQENWLGTAQSARGCLPARAGGRCAAPAVLQAVAGAPALCSSWLLSEGQVKQRPR